MFSLQRSKKIAARNNTSFFSKLGQCERKSFQNSFKLLQRTCHSSRGQFGLGQNPKSRRWKLGSQPERLCDSHWDSSRFPSLPDLSWYCSRQMYQLFGSWEQNSYESMVLHPCKFAWLWFRVYYLGHSFRLTWLVYFWFHKCGQGSFAFHPTDICCEILHL